MYTDGNQRRKEEWSCAKKTVSFLSNKNHHCHFYRLFTKRLFKSLYCVAARGNPFHIILYVVHFSFQINTKKHKITVEKMSEEFYSRIFSFFLLLFPSNLPLVKKDKKKLNRRNILKYFCLCKRSHELSRRPFYYISCILN